MRIVIDMQGAQTASRYRGIGRYTLGFVHGVVRHRGQHEIILALNGLFPDSIAPIRKAFEGLLPPENIRVWNAPGPVAESRSEGEKWRETAELIREAFLASLRPDVVHVTSLFEGYVDDGVTSIGRFDNSTSVSVSLYDLIPLLNPKQYLDGNPEHARYYRRKVEQLKHAAVLLAISESSRQEVIEQLQMPSGQVFNVSSAVEPRFRVLEMSADAVAELRQKFGLGETFILYTGGADERKNLACLIRAYAGLAPAMRASTQLVFVGHLAPEEISRLRDEAEKAGLSPDELNLTGYVSDDELVQLYNLCRLFVFPSWHEGFGLPVLEAMRCGAPVLCANSSSLPEVMDCPQAMFDPMNVAQLTEEMTSVLAGEATRLSLREHGLRRSQLFTWDETAKRALSAWESLSTVRQKQLRTEPPMGRKPRLAFVSPLPPERSGISTYSAELLPALAAHYDIEIVVAQQDVEDDWIRQNLPVRDVSWLRAHAGEMDRVLYQMGNSPFHQHMLPLMRGIPGVVVLHDFYLSGLISWLELEGNAGKVWTEALYSAHGYDAVIERYRDWMKARFDYPVNLEIFQLAQGVIFHAEHARDLARQWVGARAAGAAETVPLLRKPVAAISKADARNRLGIAPDAFVVCSFGFLADTKLNDRILGSWLASDLSNDAHGELIFVGENHGGDYGTLMTNMIQEYGQEGRIRITGYASPETYGLYLAAADIAVQLRAKSRGETSAAVLDCMNYGLPVIANAHGSMAELDTDAVVMLPDNFDDTELVSALESLWNSPQKRQALGSRARQVIHELHAPEVCAARYAQAIERFHAEAQAANIVPAMFDAIAGQASFAPDEADLCRVASAIAVTWPLPCPQKRLLLDVSATCRHDLKTGIERVARALLLALYEAAPAGYRVEPVYLDNTTGRWQYRAARRYMVSLLQGPPDVLDDETIEPERGDILLTLDLSGGALVQAVEQGLYTEYRGRGVALHAMVYDLLPVRMPHVFPQGAAESHAQWLRAISGFDGAVCISAAVGKDLAEWRDEDGIKDVSYAPYRISWLHLGADVANSVPSSGLPKNAEQILQSLQVRPSFLMVGTIEPRKGYDQALDAFDQLWRQGVDANLVIVGKEGWTGLPNEMRRGIPETTKRLRQHPERNKRLFWLEGISDEYLEKVYAAGACLLAASWGEGFGLPLIEAAQHGLPLIVRDIPVFREVARNQAFYFKAANGDELAQAIRIWLGERLEKNVPDSNGLKSMSWEACAGKLLQVLLPGSNGSTDADVASVAVRKKAMDEHLELIHRSRIELISNELPPGDIILDLGGANCPLYKMGYPHQFKKLYLIDLPPADRHDMYKEIAIDSDCESGEVVIRYGDMTELEDFADESVDFVWSGQSIEHIPQDKGVKMCEAAYRVLKKGGAFCLDTPNRLLTEIHTRDIGGGFIHPEHYLEYQPEQLRAMLEDVGFEVQAVWGVCEMGRTVATDTFCYEDFLLGRPLTPDVDKAYIQYFHCKKP